MNNNSVILSQFRCNETLCNKLSCNHIEMCKCKRLSIVWNVTHILRHLRSWEIANTFCSCLKSLWGNIKYQLKVCVSETLCLTCASVAPHSLIKSVVWWQGKGKHLSTEIQHNINFWYVKDNFERISC